MYRRIACHRVDAPRTLRPLGKNMEKKHTQFGTVTDLLARFVIRSHAGTLPLRFLSRKKEMLQR